MAAYFSSSNHLHDPVHDPTHDSVHLLSQAHTLHGDSPVFLTPSPSMSFTAAHKYPSPHDHHQVDQVVHSILDHHVENQLPPYPTISTRRLAFERHRPLWLRECIAEATGVFFFVFAGLASIATFTLHHATDKNSVAGFGSIFQVGWGMGMGVALAIITCAPTSGGHFNPAITICLAIWQHFPWRKVPRYIISQIFGAFLAALTIMVLYWEQIQDFAATRRAAGLPLVGSHTPASIFCSYPHPDQNLGFVLTIEFVADAFIALVVWAALDPSNPFIHPAAIPFIIGIAYADMIWGFGGITLSTNLARDLGARIVAGILFGGEAFTYHGYAPIGMLVNIPATLFGTAIYEFAFRDSLMIVGKGHANAEGGDAALYAYFKKAKLIDEEQGLKA
ncbi:hypothetical protein MCOR27_006221 [Pyricularia oryzae]|uniref:Aquaporin-like protein n=2 Tax=Pyricularia TaxID=48558 RepID=A0ABQ8NFD1_PYRGI|nr:hypothetical protein MCOR01_000594 [Pyricularia oryzae]KAI6296152.1 hypothetical protein MCOR33_007185 [Pyricularia grisea]KAI6255800.1 hypothetical protein MCOR19_007704 [Pyricularia oryzae]KAI6272413.1 hypothetical protein MCOR26_007352 [Pyricularia oryzae]KAI6276931.1 hypothetical protein MCOR27_006221 [Pyricularia oryzae]